jgi:hypothetical protein
VDFVNYLVGKFRQTRENWFEWDEWAYTLCNDKEPSAGDAVLFNTSIFQKEQSTFSGGFVHFALSLGSDLYLSLLGTEGPLSVCTIGRSHESI